MNVTDINYLRALCTEVCLIAKTTGQLIREEVDKLQRSQIETKSIHNFVTYVDKTAESNWLKSCRS
jgi:myo-inositol-1(or 4)-monophosphatase